MLCPFHIIICSSQKLGYYTLYIISDIASLCKRSCISNGKRYVQKLCKGFYQISLSASGRSDHKHIGFLNFNLIHGICSYSFIMIVNSYRHYFLGFLLSYHILIQCFFDLMRCRNIFQIQNRFFCLFFLLFFMDLFRLLSGILKTAQIDHTHIRHIHQIRIIKFSIIKLLVHGIKTFLHTICTDMYIIRQFDHRSGFTLRSAAEKTEFLLFFLFLIYHFVIIIVISHTDSLPLNIFYKISSVTVPYLP